MAHFDRFRPGSKGPGRSALAGRGSVCTTIPNVGHVCDVPNPSVNPSFEGTRCSSRDRPTFASERVIGECSRPPKKEAEGVVNPDKTGYNLGGVCSVTGGFPPCAAGQLAGGLC